MGQTPSRPRRTFYSLLGVPPRANSPTLEGNSPASGSPSEPGSPVSRSLKFDPHNHFVTSPVFTNPFILAGLRVVIALYTLITLILSLEDNVTRRPGRISFAYFTFLTLAGICAYMFASAVQTGLYALRSRREGATAGYPLQQSWPRIFQALHVLLYSSITTFPILVTIFYWSVLDSENSFVGSRRAWNAISVHILNAVFAVGEIFLTNSPPVPWISLSITTVLLGAYCGLAYVAKAAADFYPYEFLDPTDNKYLPAYVIGLAAGNAIVFVLVHFLVVLRQRLAVKYKRVAVATDEDAKQVKRDSGGSGSSA
ncbi:hypothetical protein FA15DRAFT_674937 [Coprinopsis marcescibilis]|uniref:FAR-17a/AIG1-like protein n=1 Tax=Coprinopsis marcescibilis TaxID=230819 RepID=A0A5C3KGG0_COPMA|nr:hypothetical protein FA15DRAFT_674937 [Coprinopsis marcescibilis]